MADAPPPQGDSAEPHPPIPPGQEPPPPADAAAGEQGEPAEEEPREKEDRFRTIVAITIAVVSILGAVVAFTGTLAEQSARQLDQQGLQDAATQQEIITNLSGTVQEDQRNLAPYQEDIKAAGILQSQAAKLEATDPASAKTLRNQAESYLVQARTRLSFFQGQLPKPGPTDGPVQYDVGAALTRLENNNAQLAQLRPDATLNQAEAKHGQSVNLVGLVTLFIAALLFLTLAQFTRPAIRGFFAAAGGVAAVTALALWIVVLVVGA
jgi:hypothetical protein